MNAKQTVISMLASLLYSTFVNGQVGVPAQGFDRQLEPVLDVQWRSKRDDMLKNWSSLAVGESYNFADWTLNPNRSISLQENRERVREKVLELEKGNYQNYNSFLSNRRNPKDGMEGGQVPVPAVEPQLRKLITETLINSALTNAEVKKSCKSLTLENLDTCFLPTVGLVVLDSTGHLKTTCTGTIIGPNSVITAAHCVCKKIDYVLVGTSLFGVPKLYAALDAMGNARLGAGDKTATALVAVKPPKMFNRKKLEDTFCKFGESANVDDFAPYDVAILFTKNEIPFPTYARAVVVGSPEQKANFDTAGFGPDPSEENGKYSMKRYLTLSLEERRNQLLSVSGAVGDSCKGDSGAGAYIRLSSGRLGIFATLSNGSVNCGPNKTSQYVALDREILTWLKQQVSDLEYLDHYVRSNDSALCLGIRCLALGRPTLN